MRKIKFICIKDCEVFSLKSTLIKVGDIVEAIVYISKSDYGYVEPKSEIIYVKGELNLFDYKDFPNHFIPLAEWRETQINEILNED